jgi:pimeloyl-ACP methyl ester carboxylesterase
MIATPHGAVAAWREGTEPATVLVHGWEDDNSLWSPLMAALLARSLSCVAFDLPAHGQSEGDFGLTFEVADALFAVERALGPIQSLVAHSFASGACCLAISEGLSVARATLIAPPLWPRSESHFHRTAKRMGFTRDVGDRALAIYSDSSTPERVAFDVRERLKDLDVELLIVSSLDDERMAVDDARTLAPMLDRGELFEVTGLNHRATARDPAVIERIVDFVDRGLR